MAKNKKQAAENAVNEITSQASSSNSQNVQYITTTGKASGVLHNHYQNKKYTKTWQNLCTSSTCKGKKYGTLVFNPKGTAEGEITCTACDTDYDCVSGAEKMSPPRFFLKDVNGNSNTATTVDTTIGDYSGQTTTTTSSAQGSSTGSFPLIQGEQNFQQLVAELTNGVDILVLFKRNTITVTDFETLYAQAMMIRQNSSYCNEDINLWQLEDGTYELDVNEYGFFNTVNVVYSGGVVTETYEDLVRVYGIMSKTYYDKKLTKTQAQAKAKTYLAAHIQEFGMEIKCSIIHNPAIEVGDIVTLENPLTLRDAVKKVNKGLPEYLFVKGMSISWEDGGLIKNDLQLSYSPESPERDADTSNLINTTSNNSTSSGTGSSDQSSSSSGSVSVGDGSSETTESTTEETSTEKDSWHQNLWNQLYEVTKAYIDVTNRTQYTNRLYSAKTNWTVIAGIVQGHKIKQAVTRDYVIRTIMRLKKGTITKYTDSVLYSSKKAGRFEAQPK